MLRRLAHAWSVQLSTVPIVLLSLLLLAAVNHGRSEPRLCVVEFYDGSVVAAYDPDTGERQSIANSAMYKPVSARQTSHNGKYVAYLQRDGIGSQVYRLIVQDTHTGQILFSRDRSAWATLMDGLPGYDLSWSPDDQHLAFRELAPSDTAFIRVYALDGTQYEVNGLLELYDWSPDGTSLAIAETPLEHRDDAILHFWYYAQAKRVSYPGNPRMIHALAWSPLGDVVAYVESGQTNVPTTPYRLVIASPERGPVARMEIQRSDWYHIRWAANGHYLVVQSSGQSYVPGVVAGGVFRFEAGQLAAALDSTAQQYDVPDQAWVGSKLLLFRPGRASSTDLVIYDPEQNTYRIITHHIIGGPIAVPDSQDTYIQHAEGSMFALDRLDFKTATSETVIESAVDIQQRWNPGGPPGQPLVEWRLPSDPPGTNRLTLLSADFAKDLTLKGVFNPDVNLYYQHGKLMAFHDVKAGVAGVINVDSGDVYPVAGTRSLADFRITPINSQQVMAEWHDAQNTWHYRGYDRQGRPLYAFDALPGSLWPSPHGDKFILVQSSDDLVHDTGNLALELIKQGQTTPLVSNWGAISDVVWAPDESRFAAVLTSFDGQSVVAIFSQDGQLLHQMDTTFDRNRSSALHWLPCQKLDGDIDPVYETSQ